MPALLIRLRVSDYQTWRRVFDEQGFARKANGCQGSQIFRNAADPNETFILLAWDDLLRARLFSQSDDLRESIAAGGVLDRPDLWLLDEAGEEPGA